jgi:hypothetical protein
MEQFMETTEAREHLDLVDRVLAQADQTVFVGGDIFLVWGIASALLDVVFQLRVEGRVGDSAFIVSAIGLAAAIVYSIVRGRALALHSTRMSRVQHEYLNVLWLVFSVTAVAQIGAFNIFTAWSAAALWTIASAIVTFYIGMHGSRRGTVGGVILVASLIVASFMPHVSGYVLAAGMLLGYSGFGLATMLARD